MRWGICFVLISLAVACGDDSADRPTTVRQPNPSPGVQELGNNAALLAGDPFGTGAAPLLRKEILVSRADNDARLTFGTVYALGDPQLPSIFYLAGQVSNTGNAALCFVKLMNFRPLDGSGNALIPTDFDPYISGSVMDLGSGLWTDTCIRPGETGWLLDISLSMDMTLHLYDALTSIAFSATPDDVGTAVLPSASVVPTGYHVTNSQTLVIDFLNEGPGSAELKQTDFQRYVALDDATSPVFWDFLSKAVNPQGLLKPGTMGTAEEDYPFTGSAHRIRAMMSFDPPDPSAALQLRRNIGDRVVDSMSAVSRYESAQLERVGRVRSIKISSASTRR